LLVLASALSFVSCGWFAPIRLKILGSSETLRLALGAFRISRRPISGDARPSKPCGVDTRQPPSACPPGSIREDLGAWSGAEPHGHNQDRISGAGRFRRCESAATACGSAQPSSFGVAPGFLEHVGFGANTLPIGLDDRPEPSVL